MIELAQEILSLLEANNSAFAVALASAVILTLAHYSNPRIGYLDYGQYGEREIGLLITNLDASELNAPLSFFVHMEQVTSARAFPATSNSLRIAIEDRGARVTLTDLGADESIMLIFQHAQASTAPIYRIGIPQAKCAIDGEQVDCVLPRHWGALRSFSGLHRLGYMFWRVLAGCVVFVLCYSLLRGWYDYPHKNNPNNVAWDGAILLAGVLGSLILFLVSGIHAGRIIPLPFEMPGTSITFSRGSDKAAIDAHRTNAPCSTLEEVAVSEDGQRDVRG
jgi:hypothetical protein